MLGRERLLHDGLDSVVGRVGASGAPILYRYDAWGGFRSTAQPASGEPTLAYAGQHWDAGLGLSYAQQRWYEPGTGRLLSEDPVFGRLGDPNSLMAFGYANGNPLLYTDTTGERAPTEEEAKRIKTLSAAIQREKDRNIFVRFFTWRHIEAYDAYLQAYEGEINAAMPGEPVVEKHFPIPTNFPRKWCIGGGSEGWLLHQHGHRLA